MAAQAATGARLLLPNAQNLKVTVTPLDGGLDTPEPQTFPIDTTQTAAQRIPVSFLKIAGGRYSISAVATDKSGMVLFQQTVSEFNLPADGTKATLNLVPANPTDLGAIGTAQPKSGTLAAGTSTTWRVPVLALNSSSELLLSLTADPSVLLFVQYSDGTLVSGLSTSLRTILVPKSAGSLSDALVTIYNPGTVDLPYRLILNPVLAMFYGNGSTGGNPPDAQGFAKGDTLTVPGPGSLVKTGANFAGWNTAADGSGTTTVAGDSVAIATDTGILTFYAQWSTIPLVSSVTISLNNPSDQSVTFAGGTPTLNRAGNQSITVTTSGGAYDSYRWTIGGSANRPVLGSPGASSTTITAKAGATDIGPFTVTLLYGSSGYQYSKSFAIQVIEDWSLLTMVVYAPSITTNLLSAYKVDPSTGGFLLIGKYANPGPGFSVVEPKHRFLYVSNFSVGQVSAYAINAASGALSLIDRYATGAADSMPAAIVVDPSGRFVYVENAAANTVAEFVINQGDGSLAPIAGNATLTLQGTAGEASSMSMAIDPDGKVLYIANILSGIEFYSIDQVTGALGPISGSPVGLSAGSVAVAPSGKYLYASVFDVGNYAMEGFSINPSTGAVSAPDLGAITGSGTQPMVMSMDPLGSLIYAGGDMGINGIALNPGDGSFSLAAMPTVPGEFAAFDPSGRYLFASDQFGMAVQMYAIDRPLGTLRAIGGTSVTDAASVTACLLP